MADISDENLFPAFLQSFSDKAFDEKAFLALYLDKYPYIQIQTSNPFHVKDKCDSILDHLRKKIGFSEQ